MRIDPNVLRQMDALLHQYGPLVRDAGMGHGPYITASPAEQGAACARLSAAVERFSRSGDQYREELQRIHATGHAPEYRAVSLLGVLQAVREDYAAGFTKSLEELIHADLFGDFLDMAKELLDKGFKDAAAVIAGSALESHLRQVAVKNNVPVTKPDGKPEKAETINAALGKEDYGTGEQKNVTAWLDLRNDAAHGDYDKYDNRQVALLIDSVRAFMVRHPA